MVGWDFCFGDPSVLILNVEALNFSVAHEKIW